MTVETLADIISGSHDATFEARVVEEFATGDNPDGTDIGIIEGEVVLDGTAKRRGTLELTTHGQDGQDGPNLWPRGKTTLLNPLTGNEVFVRRGVDIGSETLWTPLGYYRIGTPEQDNASEGPIVLTCQDRMATVIDSRLLQPRAYDQGTLVGDIFDDLILEVYPDATIEFDDTSDQSALGRQLIVEEKRYEALKNLADALGKIMYWDGAGVLQVKTAPEEDDPVWHVTAGEDGVLVGSARWISREGVYNAVVAEGEGGDTNNPVRGVATDANPTSLTRFGGPFGRVPRFFSSQFLTTEEQATNAAQALLRRSLGAPYTVSAEAVPNPGLEPWQPIRITQRNGDYGIHIAEKITIPLDAEATMQIDTREKTIVALGSTS